MMALTEKLLDSRGNGIGHERGRGRPGNAEQNAGNNGETPSEDVQALRTELDTVRREQAKLQQAIYEAAQIQRRLCAPRDVVCGEFEIAGEIFPVRHLSGDFFKVTQLGSVLALAVGDIAGKGLTAGIWQAHLMALVQRCAQKYSDPSKAVADVNHELYESQGEAPLTALFLGRLDLGSNELVYCNAGLPAPLVLRQQGSLERLEIGGPMLGALQGSAFNRGSVRMNSGDMLVAYTDGVTECRNSQEEEFEIRRLSGAVSAVRHTSANQALFSTLATVLDFAAGCSPEDDLTLLVVRRREPQVPDHIGAGGAGFSAARRRPGSVVRAKKARLVGESKAPNH